MKKLDIEKELSRILQEELDKIWEETPLGFNKTNNGYHMGKGLIVDKRTWDKYLEALKLDSTLKPYEFMVDLLKQVAKDMDCLN